jgi:hypothetical protein
LLGWRTVAALLLQLPVIPLLLVILLFPPETFAAVNVPCRELEDAGPSLVLEFLSEVSAPSFAHFWTFRFIRAIANEWMLRMQKND